MTDEYIVDDEYLDDDDEGLTYKNTTEMFLGRYKWDPITSGEGRASSWLSEFNEGMLSETERLNVILPLIKWCTEHDLMTDNLKGELDYYYDQYLTGGLDGILVDSEAEEIVHDLTECYKKVFK